MLNGRLGGKRRLHDSLSLRQDHRPAFDDYGVDRRGFAQVVRREVREGEGGGGGAVVAAVVRRQYLSAIFEW